MIKFAQRKWRQSRTRRHQRRLLGESLEPRLLLSITPIETKLTASDAEEGDRFGRRVAISGETAVVGAGNPLTDDSGSAYVFTRSGSTWTEQAKLTASDAEAGDRFSESVAISGETAVVGATGNKNAAYIFTRSGTTWTEQTKLTASDGDALGNSVSVSGDTVVVGAQWNETGSAYVFTRSGTTWTEQTKLTEPDADGAFGNAVSIYGDTIVVGAQGDDHGGIDSGSAYVFTRSGTTWTPRAKLTAKDADAGDQFGSVISVSGGTVLVGAAWNDSGSTYVFERNDNGTPSDPSDDTWGELDDNGTPSDPTDDTWTEHAKLTASDADAGDRFGYSVSIYDDTIVVSARGDDDGGSNSGSAYVFTRSGTTWTEQTKLTASDAAEYDEFGMDIAVSGGTVLVGAWKDEVKAQGRNRDTNSGSAYVFDLFAVPGITVSPTSGLQTDEDSSSATRSDTFTVVLDTEPADNVTIGITSSNTDEGIVDKSSLTFTTSNWSTPQTVTVTGVDDAAADGDVAYTVITEGAVSTDPGYNGLDAADVSVTNLDDEIPTANDVFATAETTVSGSVVEGDLTDTHSDDGVVETITEELYAGNKRSRLEHIFTVDDVTSGSSVELIVDATHDSAAETFEVAYSTDQATWTTLGETDQGPWSLPSNLSGSVYVRFQDTDRSRGETSQDTLAIDYLVIRTSGGGSASSHFVFPLLVNGSGNQLDSSESTDQATTRPVTSMVDPLYPAAVDGVLAQLVERSLASTDGDDALLAFNDPFDELWSTFDVDIAGNE